MNVLKCYVRKLTLLILGGMLVTLLGCQSKPQNQQPSAEEQKKIEQDYQKTLEQQKQLTSGYDKSMQYVPHSTGITPKKKTAKQQPPQHQAQPEQGQSQPQQ